MRRAAQAFGFAACVVGMTSAASANQLIVNGYGAEYEALIREHIIKPFEEKFGVTVIYDANGSASQDYARIRATGGAPGYDVVAMTAPEAILGCDEQLLEPLTVEKVPNMARLLPEVQSTVGNCGAVHDIQYMSLLYRKDRLDAAPDSWAALADPKFDKRTILPKFENILGIYLTQMFSVMEGGTLDDPDAGFEFMKKAAPLAYTFEQSSSIMGKYITDDVAWVMPFWNARGQLLVDENDYLAYVIPKEGTIPLLGTISVPAKAENKELALQFINFWLEKQQQENWAQAYNVGTIRDDVELPEDFKARNITSAADLERLQLPDLRNIAKKRGEWGAKFKREIAGLAG